jgi:hypothetical protein
MNGIAGTFVEKQRQSLFFKPRWVFDFPGMNECQGRGVYPRSRAPGKRMCENAKQRKE